MFFVRPNHRPAPRTQSINQPSGQVDAASSTAPSLEASAGSFDAPSVQFPAIGAYGSGAPDGQGEAGAKAAPGAGGMSLDAPEMPDGENFVLRFFSGFRQSL